MFPADFDALRLWPVNCDRIAPLYEWLEHAVFGRALERCRNRFLAATQRARRALVLGDGDGRFTAALLKANPEQRVHYVDLSRRMVQLTMRRVGPEHRDRLFLTYGDATAIRFPAKIQLICTHFFLDCLSDDQILGLVQNAASSCEPDSQWIVSEFQIPPTQPMRFLGSALVRLMYAAFRVTTGLRQSKLPNYQQAFEQCGFSLERSETSLAGLLVSQLWSLPDRR